MDLEANSNCRYDFVEVFDSDGRSFGNFCGTTIPDPIISSANKMLVVFNSDGSVTKSGFVASWATLESDPGGDLVMDNVTVISNQQCKEFYPTGEITGNM